MDSHECVLCVKLSLSQAIPLRECTEGTKKLGEQNDLSSGYQRNSAFTTPME